MSKSQRQTKRTPLWRSFFQYCLDISEKISQIQFTNRQLRKILVGIACFSFLLRLLCWWMEPTLSRDGAAHLNMAQVWLKNGSLDEILTWPSYYCPPLYVWFIKELMGWGIPAEAAGIGFNLVLGSLIPLEIYFIANLMLEKKWLALACGMLAAVHPMLVQISIVTQREVLYLFFSVIVLYAMLSAIKFNRIRWWGVAGIGVAGAILSRYEALEFIPVFAASWIAMFFFRRITWRNVLCAPVLFFSGLLFGIVMISWVAGIPSNYYEKNLQIRVRGKLIEIRKKL